MYRSRIKSVGLLVGPGFDSTSPTLVSNNASQPTGVHGRLSQKNDNQATKGVDLLMRLLIVIDLCDTILTNILSKMVEFEKIITIVLIYVPTNRRSNSGLTSSICLNI